MFYTENHGCRWSMMAAEHATLDAAMHAAVQSSKTNWCTTHVYDCSGGPVGVLVAVYHNGVRAEEGI